MADKVPYTGAPDTPNLRLEPTPQIHVDAPAAAFGANVGQAVENFGQVQEGAGKELFARALAFQDLTNHATARGAAVQTAHEQAALWGEFDSKGGMDAGPEALAKLHADLEAVRQKNGKDLNPTAAELYQNEAASTQSRLYIYSATHSAQAVKKYDMDNIVAGKATRDAMVTGAASIDPNALKMAWGKDVKDAVDMGHHLGEAPDSPAVKARISDNHNTTSLAAITGALARHDPDQAKALRDIAEKQGMLTGKALDQADRSISESQERIGVTKTVAETYDPKKTKEENVKAAVEASDKKTGGDVVASSRVTSVVLTKAAQQEAMDKQKLDRANSTIDEFISKIGPGTYMTPEQLRSQPELKDAFSVIQSNDERAGQTDLAINARLRQHYSTDITITPERQQIMTTLMGLSRRDSSAFVKVDPYSLDLTAYQRKEIIKLQEGMRNGGSSPQFRDRATEQTLSTMKPQVEAAFGKRGTPEYNDFHDSLQQMFDFARENGKVIDPKTAQEMATTLMQDKVLKPGIPYVPFTGTSGHVNQPSEEQAANIRKNLGPNLTDAQVQTYYLKMLHDKLYGSVTAPSTPAKPGSKTTERVNPPPVITPAPPVPVLPEPASLLPRVESYDR